MRCASRPLGGRLGIAVAVAVACGGGTARAANYYWNTTTTGLWTDGANWSNNATSGGTTGVVPADSRTGDVAFFNQSSVNGDTTIELNAARSILGMTFLNSGSTLIQASASGTQTLTFGNTGITVNAGAGAVTIGDATNAVTLVSNPNSTAPSITNNSDSLLRLSNGLVSVANYGLTVTGTGTGGVQIDGGLAGTSSGNHSLTKSGNATLTLTGSNTYAGNTTIPGSA